MKTARGVLVLLAGLGGALAALVGRPVASSGEQRVAPLQLADWLRDRKAGLRVVDLRSPEVAEVTIPRAERLDGPPEASHFRSEETVILVSEDGEGAAPRAWARLRATGHLRALVLDRGAAGWVAEVLEPTLASGATPEAAAAFRRASDLSRYFGGTPRTLAPGEAPPPSTRARSVRGRGC